MFNFFKFFKKRPNKLTKDGGLQEAVQLEVISEEERLKIELERAEKKLKEYQKGKKS